MKVLEHKKFTVTVDAVSVCISNEKECVKFSDPDGISLATALELAEKLLNHDYKVKERISDIAIVVTETAEAEYHKEFGEFLVINLFSR